MSNKEVERVWKKKERGVRGTCEGRVQKILLGAEVEKNALEGSEKGSAASL